ncbi:MAG: DUF1080 domain-containing protein [Limisphaerales bacterium]
MKSLFCLLPLLTGLFVAAPAISAAEPAKDAEHWEPLFNGRDLTGWTPKFTGHPLGSNYLETFRAEDGLLKVCYANYTNFSGQFGHLFWREKLSNYVLRVEYRFVGRQVPGGPGWAFRNSGVMIHGEDPAGMTLNQDFPTSIEVQLLGGSGQGKRTTANVCTPGTHIVMDGQLIKRHCTDSTSQTYHGDQWVTVEIEVRGSRLIRHKIEGETVLAYTLPQLDENDAHARTLIRDGKTILEGGTISLQAESHPVEFRRVELRRLED